MSGPDGWKISAIWLANSGSTGDLNNWSILILVEKLLASIIVLRICFLYTIGCDTKEKGSSLQSKKDIDGTMESHTKSAFAENFYLFETSDNIIQKR